MTAVEVSEAKKGATMTENPVRARARIEREGLIGRKVGMSQVFSSEGGVVPVTVIQVGPCTVLDVRTEGSHGYSAVQLGFEEKKQQRVDRALQGHFARAGKGCFQHVKEVRCDAQSLGWTTLGQELKVGDLFTSGELVDVSGTSIGRGFAGVMKRHHMKGQPATRGTHEYRRHGGAVGCRKFPHHIFKNKRMPGHMGNAAVTVKNLKVVAVDAEQHLLFVRGAIPGSTGSIVTVRRAKNSVGKKA